MQVRILCRALLASNFFLTTYVLLGPWPIRPEFDFFRPGFHSYFFLKPFEVLIQKFKYTFLNQFPQQSVIRFCVCTYSLKCF